MVGNRIALVVGGSGLVGGHLLQLLLDNSAYKEVRSLGRTMPDIKHPKFRFIPADLFNQNYPRSALVGVHDVFCAIGTTQKKTPNKNEYHAIDVGIPASLAKVSSIFKVSNFLVVSSIGASSTSSFFYLRTKAEMEEMVITSGVPVVEIFRPSTLLGKRKEFRFGESVGKFFDKITRWFMPKKYRAIHAKTVAKAMIVRATDNHLPGVSVWESYQLLDLSKLYKSNEE